MGREAKVALFGHIGTHERTCRHDEALVFLVFQSFSSKAAFSFSEVLVFLPSPPFAQVGLWED